MSGQLSRIVAAHEALRASDQAAPWLAERRGRGLESLLASGLPTLRDEDWRYLNLRSLREAELRPAAGDTLTARDDALDAVGWSVDLRPGSPHHIAEPPPEGVRVVTLRQALDESEGESLRAALGSAVAGAAGAMTAFNDAFLADALLLTIEDGAEVAEPLIVNWLCESAHDALSSPRLLVQAGVNARATVVEQRVTGGGFCNGVSELLLGDGAHLDYLDIKRDAGRSHSFGSVFANVGRDAVLNAYSVSLGGQVVRNNLLARLCTPGAEARLHGVFVAGENEQIDNHTAVDHLREHTHSSEDYRGIIGKLGHGVFNGKVVVHPDAQKISSEQSNDNILLDDSAEIDTKPELQIYADDVRCSHGATVGRLDDTSLFYLRSRGIDPDDARAILLDAFARRSLETIRDETLRDAVAGMVAGYLATTITETRS